MITRARLWLRSVIFRGRLEREMQAEMTDHLARSTERLVARGLSPDLARRQAMLEFGRVTDLQEEGRMARGAQGLDALLGDMRFAFRHFLRHPLSTLTMVLVLSIGIAINVVLFTVLRSVTDRPPSGVESLDDMVRIRGSELKDGNRRERAFARSEVEAYADLTRHFSSVAAWTSQPVTAAAPDVAAFTVTATFVTDDYFDVLGVKALRGRSLVRGDAAQVAVLSHAAWTRSFAQDPGILGRTITLADVAFTIVGVAAPRFRGAAWEARDDMQVWVPLASHDRVFPGVSRESALFSAVGRLQAGTTREDAGVVAKAVAARSLSVRNIHPDSAAEIASRDPSVEVVRLLADNLEPGAEADARFATIAFSVLGLLTLLVTCANVGALQTGLALARRREVAIRMSLGAHRGRVIRQLVTESVALAIIAALGAVGVTWGLVRLLLHIVGSFSFELVLDQTAVAFAFGIALPVGLLFGLSPALHATRNAVAGALRDSSRAIAGGRGRLQRGLVVAQIALTQPLAVCVAATVYMGIDVYQKNPANPNGEQIIQLRLTSSGARGMSGDAAPADPGAASRDRQETEVLLQALRGVPNISHAAFIPERAPVNLEAYTLSDSEGSSSSGKGDAFYLIGRSATPGYLDLIGTPVVLGRDLVAADSVGVMANAIPVVIGDDMARRLWGEASPIGRRVERAGTKDPLALEVVGVYREDVAALGHSRNPFTVMVPPDPRLSTMAVSRLFMLRVSSSADAIVSTIREVVRDKAPRAAIMELRTLASQQAEERAILWGAIGLFSTAGLVVLLLCALGLYAVVAFAVGERTGEIAVRMAVGARAGQIVGHFAADGLRLTFIGVLVGLPISLFGLRQVVALSPSSEVPDVSVAVVTAVVAIAVMTVAALASWLPASRAADVDPAVILGRP